MTVAGWAAAVVLQLVTGWLGETPTGVIAIIFTALLLPSVCTALFGAPRIWKHAARFLLGVLMVSAIWLFVVADAWWIRVVLAGVYFGVKIPLDRRRRAENQRLLQLHGAKKKPAHHRH